MAQERQRHLDASHERRDVGGIREHAELDVRMDVRVGVGEQRPGRSCARSSTPASAARTHAPAGRDGSSAAPAGRRVAASSSPRSTTDRRWRRRRARSAIGADGWSFSPSPTPGVSTPLRSRIAGLWIAPALTTTRSASSWTPSAVSTPIARRSSNTTRSTWTSPTISRFGRERIGSRYASTTVTRRPSRRVSGTGPASGSAATSARSTAPHSYSGDELGVDQVIGEERPAGQRDHRVHGARTAEPPATSRSASAPDRRREPP